MGLWAAAAIRVWQDKSLRLGLFILGLPVMSVLLASSWLPINGVWRLLFLQPWLGWVLMAGWRQHTKLKILLITVEVIIWLIYLVNPVWQREQWRQSVTWVRQKPAPVVSVFSAPFAPLQWYGHDLPLWAASQQLRVKPSDKEQWSAWLSQQSDLWTYDYLQDLTDPDRQFYQFLRSHGWQEQTGASFIHIGAVRYWQKSSPGQENN